MLQISKRLKQFRQSAGFSQKQLAIALGITDKAISAYESGRTAPSIEVLYRISKQLDKPLISFLEENGEYDSIKKIAEIESLLNKANALLKDIKQANSPK